MPIKILHVITDLDTGGAERMLEKLVLGMRRDQFENQVVSLTTMGVIGPLLQKTGIAVEALRMNGAAGLPSAIGRLSRIVDDQRPDIVQTWLYHADLVGTLAHWWSHSPAALVWNIRCSNMRPQDDSLSTRLVRRAAVGLSRRPAAILVNSEAGRRHHVALGYRPPRWQLIPNGFDLEVFRPQLQAGTALRTELGLPNEVKLIGMVARYDPMKDHCTFLAMAERLAGIQPQAHFVLIGRGCDIQTALFAKAKQRLGGRLHLLGERRDVDKLLPALDLCVLSSAYGEGFPNVLGEALACGVPCLVTDVGDSAAIVGDCGISVPPRNPEALTDAAHHMMTWSSERLQDLSKRARLRAEQCFGLPAVIRSYQDLYREISS